jgi:hypothetical protein
MANADIRKGLVPVGSLINGGYVGKSKPYYVPSTYATALFVGDPVIITGTSNTARVREFAAGTLPEVNLATAGATNKITGVITGFDLPEDGASPFGAPYSLASTAAIVYVNDDPWTIYEIQADSANAVAATDIGGDADIIFTHSGDTVSGLSGCELDTSAMTAGATAQLHIYALAQHVDNALGTNAKLLVTIKIPSYAHGVAGV